MSRVTPEREVAFAVLRRTFEQDEHTEAAFREEAEAAGLEGRTRSQAQRLAFGAVQRRGTTDSVISSFTKQKGRRPDPPVAAALRLGIFELLYADGTPDHAAVDPFRLAMAAFVLPLTVLTLVVVGRRAWVSHRAAPRR